MGRATAWRWHGNIEVHVSAAGDPARAVVPEVERAISSGRFGFAMKDRLRHRG